MNGKEEMTMANTRLTNEIRHNIRKTVINQLEFLTFRTKFPIDFTGKSAEEVLEELCTLIGDDFAQYMMLRSKYRASGAYTSDSMCLGIPEIKVGSPVDSQISYGVSREEYNRHARIDWIQIFNLPRSKWLASGERVEINLDLPRSAEVVKWVCAYLATQDKIKKMVEFTWEAVAHCNSAGQLLRVWPGIQPYLPNDKLSIAAKQVRVSQLPDKGPWVDDYAMFTRKAAQVEQALADAIMTRMFHETNEERIFAVVR